MKLVQDDEINSLTHAFKKLAKWQNGKKNRLKNPKVFHGTYEQLLKDFNMFLPKGKLIAWKEENPLVKKKRKVAKFESRIQDLGSERYTEYCEALEMFYNQSKTPVEVYRMVAEMFDGHCDLLMDFEKFCGDLLSDSDKKKQKIAIFESKVHDLGSGTYNEFCRALEMLETRRKTPVEAQKMVAKVFEGRGDLLMDFEKFYDELFTEFNTVLPLPLIDHATMNTKTTSEPMQKRKFDDGHIQGNCCASNEGHVEIVLEPKVHGDNVSPTPPSKDGPTQAFFTDDSPKSTSDKDLLILPSQVVRNDVESPQPKRVVKKKLKTDRPTSQKLEKRFNELWKTYGKED